MPPRTAATAMRTAMDTTTADVSPNFVGAGAPTALLRLMHLVSPALPVGAYAYSQGLETAVERGWVVDEAGAFDWIGGLSRRNVGSLDLPVLVRLTRAWAAGDAAAVQRWNARLLAARETMELRAEDQHLGRSLLRILQDLGVPGGSELAAGPACFAAAFALAGVRLGIGEHDILGGYLWAWTENQVLAAVKLVPLGQSAGQRLLHRLIEAMPQAIEHALVMEDDHIGATAVAQTLASAWHETQYTRLFRS